MSKSRVVQLALVLFALGSPALAQEPGRAGIVFQVPTALGFIWHPSANLAVRPEVSYSKQTSEVTLGSGTTSTVHFESWTVGVSVPYYMAARENVRAFLSPRLAYTKIQGGSKVYSLSGSFGAQYAPTARFNIYGESGYTWSRQTSEFTKSTSWNPRSAVGVILYLGK